MKGKRGPDGRGRPVKVPVVQGTNGYVRPEMPTGDSGGREAIVPVAERRTTVATGRHGAAVKKRFLSSRAVRIGIVTMCCCSVFFM